MASIFRRGSVWWCQYYRPGSRRAIRASLHTKDEATAKRELKKLEGRLASGNYSNIRINRIRFGHLLDLLLAASANDNLRSIRQIKSRIKNHLRPAFGERRATTINAADITFYIEKRKESASNASINRELDLIKKAFRLGDEAYKIPCPPIHKLRESNARQGFLDRAQVEAICRRLPDHYAAVVRFGFLTGWRKSEITSLEWRNVDFDAGEIRLDTSKNEEGRVIRMTAELRALLESRTPAAVNRAKQMSEVDKSRVPTLTNIVFTRTLINGRILPIGDIGKVWDKACIDAGVGKRHFHDLRRSFARIAVRAGVPERIVMAWMGHKTRAMLDRYNIVSMGDLDNAAAKLDAATVIKAQPLLVLLSDDQAKPARES